MIRSIKRIINWMVKDLPDFSRKFFSGFGIALFYMSCLAGLVAPIVLAFYYSSAVHILWYFVIIPTICGLCRALSD